MQACCRLSSEEVVLHLVTQFRQGAVLNLSHALFGNTDEVADLFQRLRAVAIEALHLGQRKACLQYRHFGLV